MKETAQTIAKDSHSGPKNSQKIAQEKENRFKIAEKKWKDSKSLGLKNEQIRNTPDRYSKGLGKAAEMRGQKEVTTKEFDTLMAKKMLIENHKHENISKAIADRSPKAAESKDQQKYGKDITAHAMNQLKEQKQNERPERSTYQVQQDKASKQQQIQMMKDMQDRSRD